MTTLEKIEWLAQRCKGGFGIDYNDHRSSYVKVEDYIDVIDHDEIPPDVLQRMKETDTMIRVQGYPNSCISFYVVHHYDLEKAIDIIYETIVKVPEW